MSDTKYPRGAMIESGVSDWQIFQQDPTGHADIAVAGRWQLEQKGRVELRIVEQDTGAAISSGLDWHPADQTNSDGTWTTTLRRVPAGGLYRLETRYRPSDQVAGEWSPRGDMRHFIGVGDLWVIAGQSNSVGYGRGPYNDPPEPGIHMFRHSEQWTLATHPMGDSTDTRHPVNREAANPGHSPYLQFGRVLKRVLGYPIGLIPTALGGSPLSRWNPTEPEDSDLFENMVHGVKMAGGAVRGICWYQGESDTQTEAKARSYADRFVSAVRAWREALHAPELPVLTVQLNRTNPTTDQAAMRIWSIVRENQRQVLQRLSDVAVVPSLDLTVCDGIHISSEGNLILGERLARAALGMVYGRPVNWQTPDLQSATRIGNGDGIELKFAPVSSRIASMDSNVNPFLVEDKDGPVAIRKVVYPGCDTIQLELERKLGEGAKVHAGYGVCPALMPADFERQIPVLAFYEVPIA